MAKSKRILSDWHFEFENNAYPATVPGDVVADLMANGLAGDALYADNYKGIGWVHERDWTYFCDFSVSKEEFAAKQPCVLLTSVDTFSDVYLNGGYLGSTDSMFRAFCFDASGRLRAGGNRLEVRLRSVRKKLAEVENPKYFACFNDKRLFVRKAACHFGWDWAPNFPGTGICGKAYLVTDGAYAIDSVRVTAELTGAVSMLAELSYNNRAEGNDFAFTREDVLTLRVAKTPFGDPKAGYVKECKVFGAKNMLNVRIKNPQLWYANGYGAQPLYPYEVELTRNGALLDRFSGRFGIRSFTVEEPPRPDTGRYFDMYLNGRPFRAIGSNWVPASVMTGTVGAERYGELLRIAKNGGLNMLRVWGGGRYEDDAFYDLCDELGILVWQDFMFACSDMPDDLPAFRDTVEAEAREQVVRLRNHPAVAIWCGGNELHDTFRCEERGFGHYVVRTLLPGLLSDLDGTRKYVWNSPYSWTDVGNDASSGDCHNNASAEAVARGDIERFRAYHWAERNAFDTECAVIGPCRLKSFRKFMPEKSVWPPDALWEDRLGGNPYEESVVSFTERIKRIVDALFGGAETAEEFFKKGMTAHMEILRSELEAFRSDPKNSGVLNWMYNDVWGNATWSLVDYYLEKKPAYYAMKRCAARRTAFFTQEPDGYYLHAVNDTEQPLTCRLSYSHRLLSGEILRRHKKRIKLAPFSQTRVKVEFDERVKNAFLYAEFAGESSVFFYDLWKDKAFTTRLTVEKRAAEEAGGHCVRVTVRAEEFARCVFLDLPEGFAANYSDNFFDLPKGMERTVTIRSDAAFSPEDVRVLTYADVWPD